MEPVVVVDGEEPVEVGVRAGALSVVVESEDAVSLALDVVIVAFEDPVMAVLLLGRPVTVVMVELWGLVNVPVVERVVDPEVVVAVPLVAVSVLELEVVEDFGAASEIMVNSGVKFSGTAPASSVMVMA